MRPALPLLLIAALGTAGCARVADSRFNPFNWFGGSTAVQNLDSAGNLRPLVTSDMVTRVVDGRVLVNTVDALEVSRTPEGAIVRATGTAATQGGFNAQLVPVGQDGGTLTFAFRVEQPQGASAGGPAATRQVTVARILTSAELSGVRTIRVQGAANARVSRR